MSDLAPPNEPAPAADPAIHAALGARSIVLVGMMGAGKSSIGRRLAQRLDIPFIDADTEIEIAAGMNIPEIFAAHGEPYFRAGEARVIARLLESGPQVLATGGGAFMNADTRALIAQRGVSVWLRASVDVLVRRLKRRGDRPLLKTDDPGETLRRLVGERYPTYAQAAVTVESRDVSHDAIVDEIIAAIRPQLGADVDAAASIRSKNGMTATLPSLGPTIVDVALGDRAYEIAIGRDLLPSLGARIAALRPGVATVIVTDENVASHHLAAAKDSLTRAGVRSSDIVVAPGEKSKGFATFETLCEAVIAAKIERNDLIVALGGGVIGDLAGFAAASVRRGLDFVQVPTTLLAQVDSSVGGKTGINSAHGKNLIGAFHQPILVIADTALLDTLPEREFRAGYAEVVKYGLLGDRDFFEWCEAHWRDLFAGASSESKARERAIAVSCRAKAAIVARDERETGDRMLLNLGHTFGHAFEAAAGFSDRLLHGEAVGLGMALAFEFSARRGLMHRQESERVIRHLAAVGLPTRPQEVQGGAPSVDTLMELIAQDKKVQRGALTFILTRGIGDAFVARDVDAGEVRAFLAEKLA